ncbi:hypothetical protein [Kordiimonas sp. SCSIO 12610]|uniref:hypothetical protein n=1 Tax=Kordiimonas sp. SCSIO 12610 TaxID=2829597 RepID=UPI002109C723|nr:hypothetical protein [Kordiimonas sp. SCSIO 12610]UTW54291.1 hypothetical protein KFF44_10730 [Kordiimonas sp. SCSIO 12610]
MTKDRKILLIAGLAIASFALGIAGYALNKSSKERDQQVGDVPIEQEKKKDNKAVWIALFPVFMGSGVAIFAATSRKRKQCKPKDD